MWALQTSSFFHALVNNNSLVQFPCFSCFFSPSAAGALRGSPVSLKLLCKDGRNMPQHLVFQPGPQQRLNGKRGKYRRFAASCLKRPVCVANLFHDTAFCPV